MEIKNIIDEAIRNGRTITIKYQKYGGEYSERTISKIQPSEEFGEGYIKAYCHLRHEDRTFKISRIISATQIERISTYAKTESHSSPAKSITHEKTISIKETSTQRKRTPIEPIGIRAVLRTPTRLSDNIIWDRPSSIESFRVTPKSPTDNKPTNIPQSNNKSEGCYIATMAYGDYDHPQVLVLRDFRDNFLLPTHLGRLFVRFYYWISPELVRILNGHERINYMIRKTLDFFIKIL